MKKLLLMILAAAAIFAPVNRHEVLAEGWNEKDQIDEEVYKDVQPAPIKPENSAEATVKKSVEVTNEITVDATAYTAECEGCSGMTFTGVDLKADPNAKVIAVDPEVIPLGSKVYVQGYGFATASDIGGGIDGKEIDVFIPKEEEAENWGRQEITVKVIEYS